MRLSDIQGLSHGTMTFPLCQVWQSFDSSSLWKKEMRFGWCGEALPWELRGLRSLSASLSLSLSNYIYIIHIHINMHIHIYTYMFKSRYNYIYNVCKLYKHIQKRKCAKIHGCHALIFEGQTSQANPVDMGECDRTNVIFVIFQCQLNLKFWCDNFHKVLAAFSSCSFSQHSLCIWIFAFSSWLGDSQPFFCCNGITGNGRYLDHLDQKHVADAQDV